MEKILLVLVLCFFGVSAYCNNPEAETDNSSGPENEFWPADLVPHPHPPWNQPSGPSKPELA